MSLIRNFLPAIVRGWERFNTELGWSRSSHVALSMMLALFPFCVFVLAVGAQLSAGLDKDELIEFVFGAWPDEIAEPIVREVLAVLDQSSTRTAAVGAILAMFFASNGVDAVRVAITHAYREEDPRPLWRKRLLALVFVLVGSGILSLASLVGLGLPLYFHFVSDAAPSLYARLFSSEAIRNVLTASVLLFAVYAAHAWLPGIRRPAKVILPGVLLTIVLWVAAGSLFAGYLRSFGSYSLTYAGLAGTMAALVFMYLMAAILIFAAEVNGQLMRMSQPLNEVSEDQP